MPLTSHPFRASKKLYAINSASFRFNTSEHDGITTWSYMLDAVYFTRRANGKRAAGFGILWDHSSNHPNRNDRSDKPWTFEEFMHKINTDNYGVSPKAIWDGSGAWWEKEYADDVTLQQAVLPFLQHMLTSYPDIPAGYEGWYLLQSRWAAGHFETA